MLCFFKDELVSELHQIHCLRTVRANFRLRIFPGHFPAKFYIRFLAPISLVMHSTLDESEFKKVRVEVIEFKVQ